MAKRVRGSRSAHRPGGQGPSRTKKPSSDAPNAIAEDAAAPEPELVDDVAYSEVDVEVDEVAAAAIAAVAAEPQEGQEQAPRRTRRRDRRRSAKQRTDDLTARGAAESVWVRADLRRIGLVSVVLLALLAAGWVIFGVLDVLSLY